MPPSRQEVAMPPKALCRDVRVLELLPLGQSKRPGEFFELKIENPGIESFRPGQFVMLRPASFGQGLTWGRPFSIAWADEDAVGVFFQTVGRGTGKLSQARPGESLAVWGPLGNGFTVEPATPTLLLAGGMGLAPFYGYVMQHPQPKDLTLVFAHRQPADCYPFERMAPLVRAEGLEERSPADLPGIVAAIETRIAEFRDGLVLACGPLPFLRTVQRAAGERGTRAELSLETRMGCGVGACLGCVVRDASGRNLRVCAEGPVFDARAVDLGGM